MCIDEPLEQLLQQVQSMDRDSCIARLKRFEHPRLDFSDAFLAALSTDRVRHLLMAACIQAQRAGTASAA